MFGLCRIFGRHRHCQEDCCHWPEKIVSSKNERASLEDKEKTLKDELDAVQKEKAALKD